MFQSTKEVLHDFGELVQSAGGVLLAVLAGLFGIYLLVVLVSGLGFIFNW